MLPPVPIEGPRAVLVADDEAILQRLVARVLERAGFEVVTVADGAAAVAVFEREPHRFGAVVLDVGMPRGGAEALRAILERRADVPIVLTSGSDPDPSLRALLAARSGIFLAKPFAPDALLAAVRRAQHGLV
jgi:two-component system C4-dicarboxylate transport response regulator DctD